MKGSSCIERLARLFGKLAGLVLLGSIALGCSDGRLDTYPVAIEVSYDDGTPMHGGVLSLSSTAHKKSATGNISSSGECKVGTYEPGDGAVEGTHQVAIMPARPAGDPDEVAAVTYIDPKYNDSQTSGLTIEVKPTGKNEFRLQVPRLKKK